MYSRFNTEQNKKFYCFTKNILKLNWHLKYLSIYLSITFLWAYLLPVLSSEQHNGYYYSFEWLLSFILRHHCFHTISTNVNIMKKAGNPLVWSGKWFWPHGPPERVLVTPRERQTTLWEPPWQWITIFPHKDCLISETEFWSKSLIMIHAQLTEQLL